MKVYLSSLIGFIFIQNITQTLSSHGDNSNFYRDCVKKCLRVNCTEPDGMSFTPSAAKLQDRWSWLLQWNCGDECQYHCMWRTNSAFLERQIPRVKFHGKWPFKRFLGIQEPASVFGSLMNLAAHVYMGNKIIKDKRFSVKTLPLLRFWYVFLAVMINGWCWSAIFHTRDTPFTEFMDYSCALSLVTALFIAAIVRVFHKYVKALVVVVLFTAVYYAEHVRYLGSGLIDYDYNMRVNIFFGALGATTWVMWALAHWHRTGNRYVWPLILFNKLMGASLLLELIDFPPLADTWDAHAFWHLSTAPLPLLFYRFVIDDLTYLQTTKMSDKTVLKFA